MLSDTPESMDTECSRTKTVKVLRKISAIAINNINFTFQAILFLMTITKHTIFAVKKFLTLTIVNRL